MKASPIHTEHEAHLTDGKVRLVATITPRLPPVVLPREKEPLLSQDLPLHPQRRVLIRKRRTNSCATSFRRTYPAFERTADDLATRIPFLLELVGPAAAAAICLSIQS